MANGAHGAIDSKISQNNLNPKNIKNQVKSGTLSPLKFLIDAMTSFRDRNIPYNMMERQNIGWTGHERGQVDVGEDKMIYDPFVKEIDPEHSGWVKNTPSFGFWGEDYLRRESKNGELDKNWISKNMSINPKVPKPYGTYSVKSSTGMPENQEYRDLYKLFQKIVPMQHFVVLKTLLDHRWLLLRLWLSEYHITE